MHDIKTRRIINQEKVYMHLAKAQPSKGFNHSLQTQFLGFGWTLDRCSAEPQPYVWGSVIIGVSYGDSVDSVLQSLEFNLGFKAISIPSTIIHC